MTNPPLDYVVDYVASDTIRLEPGLAQQRREKLGPDRQGVDDDVLVDCMRAAALRAEPVEHRHPERADEVAVGAAGRRRLVQVEAERAPVPPRLFEEQRRAWAALERRPRPESFERDF